MVACSGARRVGNPFGQVVGLSIRSMIPSCYAAAVRLVGLSFCAVYAPLAAVRLVPSVCSVCAMPAAVCLVTLPSCAVSAMPAAVRLVAFRFCPVCTVSAAVGLTAPSVPCSPSSAWSFCFSTLLSALCYARSCPHAFCVCSRRLDRSVIANPAVVRFVVLLFCSACAMLTAVCLASPSFF